MIPCPTVCATAVVTKAPARFATAAMSDRLARRERPRRDGRRDRVRGVVEAVREVEDERRRDDDDQEGVFHYLFLTRIASRTSAVVLEGIDCLLELLVDVLPPDDRQTGPAPERNSSATACRTIRSPSSSRSRSARNSTFASSKPSRQRHARVERLRGAMDHVALFACPLGHAPHVVQLDVLGRLVDAIADVVDRRREPEDVLAVEGRHERPVHEADQFGRQPVTLVLALPDLSDQIASVAREGIQEVDEQLRDRHGVLRTPR